ncbi:hypothetical protein AX16_005850 [Volvariella volvacea WC 439]|nr:hypothetical protein AX16_005850 [Volvariella volvacea WC 439]
MNPSYRDCLLRAESELQRQYARARELSEVRNSYVPIHQLSTEILCRIFKLVHATLALRLKPALLWHPEIVHVCRYWRSIGLGMSTLWEFINPPPGMSSEALACYISRARKSQNIELTLSSTDWHFVLSRLKGSNCRVVGLNAHETSSCKSLIEVGSRFSILSSVARLNIHPSRRDLELDTIPLPADLPFFTTHQGQPEEMHLGDPIEVPWGAVGPQFSGLRRLSASVAISCREDRLAFLDALEHMTLLRELAIMQFRGKTIEIDAFNEIYHRLRAQTLQPLHPTPTEICLEFYGDIETRIILMSLSLSNLESIKLTGRFFSSNSFLRSYSVLKERAPRRFLDSAQHLSLGWSWEDRNFMIRGLKRPISSVEYLNDDDLAFQFRGCHSRPQDPLLAPQHLRDIVNVAKDLVPNTPALHIDQLGCKRLRDGTWPALFVLQSFPHITRLSIEVDQPDMSFFSSSGLSCLWNYPGDSRWLVMPSQWSWSELDGENLAIGVVKEVNSVEAEDGSEPSYDGLILGKDRFLIRRTEQHCRQYELNSQVAVELIENCVNFRRAIGLPLSKIAFPYQDADGRYYASQLRRTGVDIVFGEFEGCEVPSDDSGDESMTSEAED